MNFQKHYFLVMQRLPRKCNLKILYNLLYKRINFSELHHMSNGLIDLPKFSLQIFMKIGTLPTV